jgi:thiol-disulfide isomerase/thioredoxin
MKPIALVFLLLTSLYVFPNDSVSVSISFDSNLKPELFSVEIGDGINSQYLSIKEKRYWSGHLYAPYGGITIYYNTSDTTSSLKKVFFNKGKVFIHITESKDSSELFAIDEKRSTNLVGYEKLGGAKLDSFIKWEAEKFWTFLKANRRKIGADSEITQKAESLGASLLYKEMEFVQKHPSLYISFWTFLNRLARARNWTADSTLHVYNTSLTDKYKNSKAGQYIVSMLQNKVNIATGKAFPAFSVTDINNNKLESSKLRGNYVLIQFWASWCVPCIAEVPALKIINDLYKDTTFKLISITTDRDSLAFSRAIQKHDMNWSQVFGDLSLYKALGGTAIPMVFLLDKNGNVIFNRDTTKDFDLVLLRKILQDRLKK